MRLRVQGQHVLCGKSKHVKCLEQQSKRLIHVSCYYNLLHSSNYTNITFSLFGKLRRGLGTLAKGFLPRSMSFNHGPAHQRAAQGHTHQLTPFPRLTSSKSAYALTPEPATVSYLSADLSKDWQLPDKEFSALLRGSSICKASHTIKPQPQSQPGDPAKASKWSFFFSKI